MSNSALPVNTGFNLRNRRSYGGKPRYRTAGDGSGRNFLGLRDPVTNPIGAVNRAVVGEHNPVEGDNPLVPAPQREPEVGPGGH